MTIYLAAQPFCVCLVSCCNLQPESRGVFLKGVEEMQALSGFSSLYLLSAVSAPQGSFPLGRKSLSKIFPSF